VGLGGQVKHGRSVADRECVAEIATHDIQAGNFLGKPVRPSSRENADCGPAMHKAFDQVRPEEARSACNKDRFQFSHLKLP